AVGVRFFEDNIVNDAATGPARPKAAGAGGKNGEAFAHKKLRAVISDPNFVNANALAGDADAAEAGSRERIARSGLAADIAIQRELRDLDPSDEAVSYNGICGNHPALERAVGRIDEFEDGDAHACADDPLPA